MKCFSSEKDPRENRRMFSKKQSLKHHILKKDENKVTYLFKPIPPNTNNNKH